jgi:integrase
MANTAKWEMGKHGFYALYHTTERANPLSMSECADAMTKEFNMYFEKSKVSRIVAATRAAILENASLKQEYEDYKKQEGTAKGALFTLIIGKDGKETFDSPYKVGKQFLVNKATKKSLDGMVSALNLIYKDLGRVDPEKWTFDMVKRYLDEVAKESMDAAFHKCVKIRNLLPRTFGTGGLHPIPTDQYKRSVNERVKTYDLFTDEVEAVCKHLDNEGLWYVEGLHRLHLVLGCREGSVVHEGDKDRNENGRGGLLGLLWKNIDWRNNTIDVFEGKVKKGIMWRGCPLDNFGWNLKPFLDKLKKYSGKLTLTIPAINNPAKYETETLTIKIEPSETEIINIQYRELGYIYRHIDSVYKKIFSSSRKFDAITPHTSRHLHCNLLFERGVPSTVICGDAVRGRGFVGVGWTDKTTMETYYLSLVERTVQRFIDSAKVAHGEFRPFEFSQGGMS